MCPPFSQMGSKVSKKERKKKSCKLLKYPKARFQKRGAGGKNEQGFLLRFQSRLQKKVSALAIWCMRGVRKGRLNWTRFSMVWSPSCYPNTNKQRRNIWVNDRGGGWRRVGGRRAPNTEKCGPVRLCTLPAPAPDGTPTLLLSLLQTSSPLSTTFHNLSHLCKGPRLQSWMHGYMKVSWTWNLENF